MAAPAQLQLLPPTRHSKSASSVVKTLNHFLPGTPVLSFGTAGCNLTCRFCQNWDISKSREFDRLTDQASPETIAEAAQAHGCRSVAFTYNDPVIWAEYAIDIARATGRKIRQNLFWAFAWNAICLPVAAAGLLDPAVAGAAMALSSVSVVSNSLLLARWTPRAAGRGSVT